MYFKKLTKRELQWFPPQSATIKKGKLDTILATPFDSNMANNDPILCRVLGVC